MFNVAVYCESVCGVRYGTGWVAESASCYDRSEPKERYCVVSRTCLQASEFSILCYPYRAYSYTQYIDQQMHFTKCNSLQVLNFYMFRHRGVILRSLVEQRNASLCVCFCVLRGSGGDCVPVPNHVDV